MKPRQVNRANNNSLVSRCQPQIGVAGLGGRLLMLNAQNEFVVDVVTEFQSRVDLN